MKIEDIEVHAGKPPCAFTVIGPVKARVGAATVFSRTPTIDEVNQKLREIAAQMGANAIIDVTYDRGVSATSWKALTALGTAVTLTPTPPAVVPPSLSQSIEGRLGRLKELKGKGLITEADFESKKRDILSEV